MQNFFDLLRFLSEGVGRILKRSFFAFLRFKSNLRGLVIDPLMSSAKLKCFLLGLDLLGDGSP